MLPYTEVLTFWDVDGDGPNPSRPVVGGHVYPRALHIRDYAGWRPLPPVDTAGGDVDTLITWDPDGPGPRRDLLIAGGSLHSQSGHPMRHIAAFDGYEWSGLGNGSRGPVAALAVWDADDGGPASPVLVAAGRFRSDTPSFFYDVAVWDGLAWNALGAPFDRRIDSLVAWDRDGAGGEPPTLVAGGSFSQVGGEPIAPIARWDGVGWVGMGQVYPSYPLSLTTWDQDDDGPLAPQLVAAGWFRVDDEPRKTAAAWDGAEWRPIGQIRISGTRARIVAVDVDGTGPAGPRLWAFGDLSIGTPVVLAGLAEWDGQDWRVLSGRTTPPIYSLAVRPRDESGDRIYACPVSGVVDTVPFSEVARRVGDTWRGTGGGLRWHSASAVVWDPDGSGGTPPKFIAGGEFHGAGDVRASKIALWDGEVWQNMGDASSAVTALGIWEPSRIQPPQVIAAGYFSAIGGTTARRIARWDGSAWHALGTGLDGLALAMITWDSDGDSEAPGRLVVGGNFARAGGIDAQALAQWDGTNWRDLGNFETATVRALATFDADGPGPDAARLVAGGMFTRLGGVAARNVAVWDGEKWSPLGDGLAHEIHALAVYDADGEGPLPAALIAGGERTLSRWDGAAWQPLASIESGLVLALMATDPDDEGPRSPVLLIGGRYCLSGETTDRGVLRWDGATLSPLGGGDALWVRAFAAYDPDGPGYLQKRLGIFGDFILADNHQSSGWAIWEFGTRLSAQRDPRDRVVCGGSTTAVSVVAIPNGNDVEYEWQVADASVAEGWRDLTDGPVKLEGVEVGVVSGSRSPDLSIAFAHPPLDQVRVRCVLSDVCARVPTRPAAIRLVRRGDANCDGVVDASDVEPFIEALLYPALRATGPCAGNLCTVDLNCDQSADFLDIEPFLDCLLGACARCD